MKQWLSDFKLALIQEDVNKLENLLDGLDMKAFIKNLAKESPSEDFLKENANDVLDDKYEPRDFLNFFFLSIVKLMTALALESQV